MRPARASCRVGGSKTATEPCPVVLRSKSSHSPGAPKREAFRPWCGVGGTKKRGRGSQQVTTPRQPAPQGHCTRVSLFPSEQVRLPSLGTGHSPRLAYSHPQSVSPSPSSPGQKPSFVTSYLQVAFLKAVWQANILGISIRNYLKTCQSS